MLHMVTLDFYRCSFHFCISSCCFQVCDSPWDFCKGRKWRCTLHTHRAKYYFTWVHYRWSNGAM